eukprot:UN17551
MSGLVHEMERIEAHKVDIKDLLTVHAKQHVESVEALREYDRRNAVQERLENLSAFANKHTTEAALVSAGGVLELVKAVCEGQLRNGIAMVRPPGHHAEGACIKGFCYR